MNKLLLWRSDQLFFTSKWLLLLIYAMGFLAISVESLVSFLFRVSQQNFFLPDQVEPIAAAAAPGEGGSDDDSSVGEEVLEEESDNDV